MRTFEREGSWVTVVHLVTQQEWDGGPIEFGGYEDGSLNAVLRSFHEVRAEIPVEYRASARCELSSESGYEGSHYASVEISYERPATPEEIAIAKQTDRDKLAAAEQREIALLRELQRKYAATP